MAQVVPVPKTNFSAGEIGPEMQAQVDSPQYAAGLKTLKNAVVLPSGAVTRRLGTKYVAEAQNYRETLLRSFAFTDGEVYVLEFASGHIRFYKEGRQIETAFGSGIPYEITLACGPPDEIRIVQSGDTLILTTSLFQQQLLFYYSERNWVTTTYDYGNGPFMPLNFDPSVTIIPSAITGNITLTSTHNIFSNLTGKDHSSNRTLWQINHLIGSQLVEHNFSAIGTSSSIKCGGTWRIVTHGTWTATILVEMSLDGGVSWVALRSLAGNGTQNYNTYGVEDYSQFLVRINCTAHTGGTIFVDLSSDPFIWKGVVQITAVPSGGGGGDLMYNTADATVLVTLADTAATADWAEGAWSKYRGYPRVAAFFQDRLVFANTRDESQTIWFSQTGIYTDFGRSSPLLDSDGITVNLPGQKLNGITAIVPLRELVVLTTGGEWAVTATGVGALAPTTIRIRCYGEHGAAMYPAPVVVGDRILYVQHGGKALRDTGYSEEAGGFQGNDLSKHAPHLFGMWKIIDMAYQQNPYGIIWAVREDGRLLSLSYDYLGEKNAWAQHDTKSNGGFEGFNAVCSFSDKEAESELWFAVYRNILTLNSNIERMIKKTEDEEPGRAQDDPETQFYVDCGYRAPLNYFRLSGVTSANPAVFHFSSGSLGNGDIIRLDHLLGEMSVLNDQIYNVYDYNGGDGTCKLKVGATGTVPVDTSGMAPDTYNFYACGIIAVHTVSGLDWLNDQEVDVLVDGVPYVHTITGNTLTLDAGVYGAYIQIGLKYVSDVEILPVNVAGQNLLLGLEVDIPLLKVWLFETLGGKAGYDEDHLQAFGWEEGFVSGDNLLLPRYDTAPFKRDLFTGNVQLSLDTKTEGNRSIMIRQDQPLPMTILAIIPFVTIPGD